MRLLIGVLTNNNPCLLKISLDSIENQQAHSVDFETVVVVNSLDPAYFGEVQHALAGRSIRIVETESNGRPGKGHNSLIQVFRESGEFDYLYLLDGDDFLYPYALFQLGRLLASRPAAINLLPTDSLAALRNERGGGVRTHNGRTLIGADHRLSLTIQTQDRIDGLYRSVNHTFRDVFATGLLSKQQGGVGTPTRMIVVSRQFAEAVPRFFDEEMFIHEDIRAYLINLQAQLEGGQQVVFTWEPHILLYNNVNVSSTSRSPEAAANFDKAMASDNDVLRRVYQAEYSACSARVAEVRLTRLDNAPINLDPERCHYRTTFLRDWLLPRLISCPRIAEYSISNLDDGGK